MDPPHPHFTSIFHFSLLRNPSGYLVSHHSQLTSWFIAMLMAALFTTAKRWQTPLCPLTDK